MNTVKSERCWKIIKYAPNGTDTYNAYSTKAEADRECRELNARPGNGYNTYKVEYRESPNWFFRR